MKSGHFIPVKRKLFDPVLTLNKKHITGKKYNNNSIFIKSLHLTNNIKKVSEYHRPAGVNYLYVQEVKRVFNRKNLGKQNSSLILKSNNISYLQPTFILNLTKLNNSCLEDNISSEVKLFNYVKITNKAIKRTNILIDTNIIIKKQSHFYTRPEFRLSINKLGNRELI